jgi:hypothetical protein
MATIADLEVKQLEDHLIAGGFIAAFTDILGNAQPAPIFQAFELDLTDKLPTERVVMIRKTGSLSAPDRTFFKSQPMLVLVVGKASQQDSVITNGLAIDMEKYLVNNPTDNGCLANIVSSGVVGPFITADGRRAFEINLTVAFNID